MERHEPVLISDRTIVERKRSAELTQARQRQRHGTPAPADSRVAGSVVAATPTSSECGETNIKGNAQGRAVESRWKVRDLLGVVLMPFGMASFFLCLKWLFGSLIEAAVSYIEAAGDSAFGAMLVLVALVTWLPFPTSTLEVLAGFLFTKRYGHSVTVCSISLAKFLSSLACLLTVRLLAKDLVQKHIVSSNSFLVKVQKTMRNDPFKITCMLEAMYFPLFMKNYSMAVMDTSFLAVIVLRGPIVCFYAFQHVGLGALAQTVDAVVLQSAEGVEKEGKLRELMPVVINVFLIGLFIKVMRDKLDQVTDEVAVKLKDHDESR